MRLLPPDRGIDDLPLARALQLAQHSASFASPNPAVGCVLHREGVVLGEGAHRYDLRDHAEIAALKAAVAAGHSSRGATAVVTLEPCAHHGRTGPCADALIAAGVTRCVVATVDPNSLVRGQGIARLRAAGIEVDLLDPTHPLALRARRLNDAFAFSIQHGRPFVTLKSALSVDGFIAPPPIARAFPAAPFWLTGPAARADVAQLRHQADALLTGIGTILADNPQFTDRTGLPRRRPLLRVVLDPHLRISATSTLVRNARHDLLLICDSTAAPARRTQLAAHPLELLPIPRLATPGGLRAVLQQLHDRQICSVLVESGPTLNAALLRAGLVDHLILYYADRELGAGSLPIAAGGPPAFLLQQQLTSVTRAAFANAPAEDIRISGYLHDPWQGV